MAAESTLSKAQTVSVGAAKARRAHVIPGSAAAAVITGKKQLTPTCKGFEAVTTGPRLGWTSQKLKACPTSVSGD